MRLKIATLLSISFAILGSTGLLVYGGYNLLPAANILEVAFAAMVFSRIPSLSRKQIIISIICASYAIYFVFVSVIRKSYAADALLAVKFSIYLSMLALLGKRKLFGAFEIRILLNTLIFLFSIKYLISVLFGLGARPGLYAENNFELLLLLFCFIGDVLARGHTPKKQFAALIAIFLLSGSRSGILALMIAVPFLLRRTKTKLSRSVAVVGGTIAAALFLMAAASLFVARFDEDKGLGSIDRFVFLLIFLKETEDWGLREILLGNTPLTALSSTSCGALSFYEKAFSLSGDGQCYSVILHSMLLRIIFDHGLLGLLALLAILYSILKGVGLKNGTISLVSAILLSNGLSVSSFNSVFAALGIAILMTTRQALVIESTTQTATHEKN